MIFQLLVFCEEDFNKTLAGKIRKYNWTEKNISGLHYTATIVLNIFFQLHFELADHIQL